MLYKNETITKPKTITKNIVLGLTPHKLVAVKGTGTQPDDSGGKDT